MSRAGPESPGCGRVRGRMEHGLDGALSPLEEALDRGHLEACAPCRDERERWIGLLARLRAATGPDAVDAEGAERVTSLVLERLGRDRTRPRPVLERLPPALIGVAAALFLLLLLQASGLGLGRGLRVQDFTAIDELCGRWPSWADVLDGLSILSPGRT